MYIKFGSRSTLQGTLLTNIVNITFYHFGNNLCLEITVSWSTIVFYVLNMFPLFNNVFFFVYTCFWSFASFPLNFASPLSQFRKHTIFHRVRSTHRHISLHNISIHVKPCNNINKPLKAYSFPLSSPVSEGGSFLFKHCIISDESSIRDIV
jgi:hypothetical protein